MDLNFNAIPDGSIKWSGSNEEFIEFVMIVTDYSICTNEKLPEISRERFVELCDALGNVLVKFFKMDISPHMNFRIMRENTKIDYRFTKRVVRIMKRLKEDEQFVQLLEERGIMPSVEYVTEELIKWSNSEKIALLLWLYLHQI